MPKFSMFQEDKAAPGTKKGPRKAKRPQSAGANGKNSGSVGLAIAKAETKNAGRAAALRAFYGEDQPLTRGNPQDMDRDELIVELKEAKQKHLLLVQQNNSLRAENQRLDSEGNKLQQKVDRLLDTGGVNPNSGNSKGHTSGGVDSGSSSQKRELEKSLLVRHLKQQILQLRAGVHEKEQELDSYKKNTKASNIRCVI